MDLQIDCRPVQISQIVINLFNNAYDAMEEANLDPRFIRLTCHVEQDHVFLTVSNPGRQIEARIQEKLFQPFFTTKEVGKGTGLGLSISKSMAKQHNGDLNYKWDSQRNENQFVLQIPLLPK